MSEPEDIGWKRLKRWSIAASISWVAMWLLVACFSSPPIWKLSLNEAGDFWAGLAAPLAFYWLVLGFFQQGKELRLQAKQMRDSVQQFKAQTNILETQQKTAERTQRIVQLEKSIFELPKYIFVEMRSMFERQTFSYNGGVLKWGDDFYDKKVMLSSLELMQYFERNLVDLARHGRFADFVNADIFPISAIKTKAIAIDDRIADFRTEALDINYQPALDQLDSYGIDNLMELFMFHLNVSGDEGNWRKLKTGEIP